MPKFFEYLGFTFYFWINEHLPIHIHVKKGEYESTFDLIITDGVLIDIKLRKNATHNQLKPADQRKAKAFIQMYYAEIITKWFKVFILDIPVEVEKIDVPVQNNIDTEKILKEVEMIHKKNYPDKK
jgi:hypothetical protein